MIRRIAPLSLLLLLSAAGGLAAQAPTPGADSPASRSRQSSPTASSPAPLAEMSASAGALRDSIVALARAQLGTRYVLGGVSPSRGFDCSGLIRYIADALKLDVPRTAAEQARSGIAVARDTSRLRPGDLLTFGTGSRVSHIGIYIGDGRFIHASTAAGRVVESRLDRKPAKGIKPWRGVRRLFADADSGDRRGG